MFLLVIINININYSNLIDIGLSGNNKKDIVLGESFRTLIAVSKLGGTFVYYL
jgi:hypothetical protein